MTESDESDSDGLEVVFARVNPISVPKKVKEEFESDSDVDSPLRRFIPPSKRIKNEEFVSDDSEECDGDSQNDRVEPPSNPPVRVRLIESDETLLTQFKLSHDRLAYYLHLSDMKIRPKDIIRLLNLDASKFESEQLPKPPIENNSGSFVYFIKKIVPLEDIRSDLFTPWHSSEEGARKSASRTRSFAVTKNDDLFALASDGAFTLSITEYTLLRCSRLRKLIARVSKAEDKKILESNLLVIYSYDSKGPFPKCTSHKNNTSDSSPTFPVKASTKDLLKVRLQHCSPREALSQVDPAENIKISQVRSLKKTLEFSKKEASGAPSPMNLQNVPEILWKEGLRGDVVVSMFDQAQQIKSFNSPTIRIIYVIPHAVKFVALHLPSEEDIDASETEAEEICRMSQAQRLQAAAQGKLVKISGQFQFDWTFGMCALNVGCVSAALPAFQSRERKTVNIPVAFILSNRKSKEDITAVAQRLSSEILACRPDALARCLLVDMESTFPEFLKVSLFRRARLLWCAQHVSTSLKRFLSANDIASTLACQLFKCFFGSTSDAARELGALDVAVNINELKAELQRTCPKDVFPLVEQWINKRQSSLVSNCMLPARLAAGQGLRLVTSNACETINACLKRYCGDRKQSPEQFIVASSSYCKDLWIDLTSTIEGQSRNGHSITPEYRELALTTIQFASMSRLQQKSFYRLHGLEELFTQRELESINRRIPKELQDGRSYDQYVHYLTCANSLVVDSDPSQHDVFTVRSHDGNLRSTVTANLLTGQTRCDQKRCRCRIFCLHRLAVAISLPSSSLFFEAAKTEVLAESPEKRYKRRRDLRVAEKKSTRRGSKASASNFIRNATNILYRGKPVVCPDDSEESSVASEGEEDGFEPLQSDEDASDSSLRPSLESRSPVAAAATSTPSLALTGTPHRPSLERRSPVAAAATSTPSLALTGTPHRPSLERRSCAAAAATSTSSLAHTGTPHRSSLESRSPVAAAATSTPSLALTGTPHRPSLERRSCAAAAATSTSSLAHTGTPHRSSLESRSPVAAAATSTPSLALTGTPHRPSLERRSCAAAAATSTSSLAHTGTPHRSSLESRSPVAAAATSTPSLALTGTPHSPSLERRSISSDLTLYSDWLPSEHMKKSILGPIPNVRRTERYMVGVGGRDVFFVLPSSECSQPFCKGCKLPMSSPSGEPSCADIVVGHYECYQYPKKDANGKLIGFEFTGDRKRKFMFCHPSPLCLRLRYPYFTSSMLRLRKGDHILALHHSWISAAFGIDEGCLPNERSPKD